MYRDRKWNEQWWLLETRGRGNGSYSLMGTEAHFGKVKKV